MKKLVFVALFISITSFAFGQKLKSGEFTVELKSYEVKEQQVPMMGKQTFIIGKFTIKKGKKKVATYDFLAPIHKGKLSHIAVLGDNGEKILPRLHYIPSEKAFTFYEGTKNEGKEVAQKSGSQKNIILSGLLIWTKLSLQD